MATKKQPTYSEAIRRLEEIVRMIDDNELEIDQLSDKIKEANRLIAFCNDKLTKADAEIEKILSDKEESDK
ncbi:MAG: exodeoxyribonuclease VII small subunit [Mediterranea massiliensis]|nr:exodeoxyribonuclease VII small subunit [Mediterranea massiliensis]